MDEFSVGNAVDQDAQAIDNLVEQYGEQDRAMVKFYRVSTETKEPDSLLEQFAPAEFNFLREAKKRGNGTYRIMVYAPNDLGKIVRKVNSVERYEGNQVATVEAASLDGIERIAQTMMEGFRTLAAQIAATQANPKIDPDAMQEKMLRQMLLFKQLFGEGQGSAGNAGLGATDVLNLITKGMEFGQKVAGNDGGASGLDILRDTIKEMGGPLMKIVERGMIEQEKRASAGMEAGAVKQIISRETISSGSEVAGAGSDKATNGDDEMLASLKYGKFKKEIGGLINLAIANRDPYIYAGVFLDQIPPVALEVLLKEQNLIDELQKVDPRIGEYRAWFDEFVNSIKEMTKEDVVPNEVDDKK